MRPWLIALTASATILTGGATEAPAQSDAFMSTMRTQHQQMMTRIRITSNVRSAARNRYPAQPGRSASRPGTSGAPSRPAASVAASTSFQPVAAPIMPRIFATEMGGTPVQLAKYEELFVNCLENYRRRLRRAGGPQNDVARAASYLISSSYDVYFDTGPLSEPVFLALRAEINDTLLRDESFRRASNHERQKMFEQYAILGAYLEIGYAMMREDNDRQGMREWRRMAKLHFEDMLGAPPAKVRLTQNGIEYR